MARNVVDRDLGLKRFMRELQNARNATVDIGVHQGSGTTDGVDIAEYAAYNEYGTSRIPERSFMRSTFDEKLQDVQRDIADKYNDVIAGRSTVYRALGLVGLRHETDIKKKIDSGIAPANAPNTVAQKGSSRTLIDTGAMRNSVRYVVKL